MQVTDPPQEVAVRRHVHYRAGVPSVPDVQFGLQAIPFSQQRAVDRCQFMHPRGDPPPPERLRVKAGSWQHVLINETLQDRRNLEAMAVNEIGHFYLHHTVFIVR